MMSAKLIMNWDVKPDKDQDYFEFLVREWVPATTGLGLQPIGAWFSVYQQDVSAPRMMTEVLADDLDTMRDILGSDGWERIQTKLLEYVENYTHKVVHATGDFQL
jgi:hypothetical protein